jgi:hypothetical protein
MYAESTDSATASSTQTTPENVKPTTLGYDSKITHLPHAACFNLYFSQSKFTFEIHSDGFCSAAKAWCSKFWLGNQGPTIHHWDSDGSNGPNTVLSSESVLLD